MELILHTHSNKQNSITVPIFLSNWPHPRTCYVQNLGPLLGLKFLPRNFITCVYVYFLKIIHINRHTGTHTHIHTYICTHFLYTLTILFFLKIFIFRVRGREGEREGEKHHCVVASLVPPTGYLACNPGMCPDWESNQRPFGSQASTQSPQPHRPGPVLLLRSWYVFTLSVRVFY